MWRLPMPARSARESFRACVGGVKDKALAARLSAIENAVERSSDAYGKAAAEGRLHDVLPETSVDGVVTAAEMSGLYSGRMARRGSPGRFIYDELLKAARHGRCPLCGQRTVSTLDHNLPKSRYPGIAVTPTNLVPACVECNRAKGSHAPGSPAEGTVHPYFDSVDEVVWLRARVVVGSPAAVTFAAVTPEEWDPALASRVKYHFGLLNLSTLYCSHAAEELTNITHQLSRLYEGAGERGVREELDGRARSYGHVRANSWQVAMYRALAESDWFCGGGFAA